MRVAGSHYYDENGAAHPVGYRLKNPAYATTLRTVASQGADAFYTGPLAASISHAVTHAERNPTALTVADMSAYQAKEREALCRNYRSFEVCGMPPPTSGGVIPLQILGLLSHFELSPTPSGELEAAHLFAEASRLAYADRSLYLADPDFVSVPVNGLLAPNYLRARAGQIHRDRSLGTAQPGTPPGADPTSLAPNRAPEIPGTTHLVAVDAQGNAVSMTASIEGAFGSHLMVGGFLLNNELTDFSFVPEQEGRAVANRVQPGKRPLSSMSPTLVFQRDGAHRRFYLALGSPGGSRIIEYVTWTLIRILDFGLDVQTAMSRPLVVNRNGDTEIETLPAFESWAEELRKYLEHRGHRTQLRELGSGLHGIRVTEDGYEGGADPRREGLVLGR
jgi:gamma-glutamyltranspeptidase/glutathione hydrolase